MAIYDTAARKWLRDFLSVRRYDGPTGQRLFKYHATEDEFLSLKRVLCAMVEEAQQKGFADPFRMHKAEEEYAAFVLYASLFWQKEFEGGHWKWRGILSSLGIDGTLLMETIVVRGLRWWGLSPNIHGHAYIGAIAREAGLPQKLLAEGHGKVGDILDKVLKKALEHQLPELHIKDWVAELSSLLPDSYSESSIVILLTDTIQNILKLKSGLQAQTAHDAVVELDQRTPNWRSEFPFPLDEDSSRKLLERLLGQVVSSRWGRLPGKIVMAQRKLKRTEEGWELCVSVDWPKGEKLRLVSEKDSPHHPLAKIDERRVIVRFTAGQSERGPVILRRSHEASCGVPLYFVQSSPSCRFKGEDAASTIILHCSTASGLRASVPCAGGMELDPELPWIFEGEEKGYEFRQQGGGTVSSKEAYVALHPGWSVEGAESVGSLEAFGRTLWKLSAPSLLRGEGEVFSVSFGGTEDGETLDWSLDEQYRAMGEVWSKRSLHDLPLAPEMVWPKQAFNRPPKAILRSKDVVRRCSGQLWWKLVSDGGFCSSVDRKVSGPAQIWFKGEDGASLRSVVLLLRESARCIVPEFDEGTLVFEDWGFSSVSLAAGQPGVGMTSEADHGVDRVTVRLSHEAGAIPPEYVDLLLRWAGCWRDVHIRMPFPQRGVRMFDSRQYCVEHGGRLCVSSLQGVRMRYWGLDPRSVSFTLSLSRDGCKSISYPLKSESAFGEIWMLDWQKRLFEILALDSGLDSYVELTCSADGKRIGHWKFFRYSEQFQKEADRVSLPDCGEKGHIRDIRAMLMNRPDMDAVSLPLLSDGDADLQSWSLAGLRTKGPWLIYDASADPTVRPVPHEVVEGEEPGEFNRLQQAIGRKSREERARAFENCVRGMLEDPMSPEWDTLIRLFKQLKHLPLSTLEVWKVLISHTRVMAVLALHHEIPFVEITSRAISELPFLWNFVTREDWAFAARFLKERFMKYCAQFDFSVDAIERYWFSHMEERLDLLKSYSPSIEALVASALELPGEAWDKKRREAAMVSMDLLRVILFEGKRNYLQELYRHHPAGEIWPEEFSDVVCRARREPSLAGLFPYMQQDWMSSVIGLPILLTLQSFNSKHLSVQIPLSPDTVYAVRKHIRFDPYWFEEACNWAASFFYGQKFQSSCEVK